MSAADSFITQRWQQSILPTLCDYIEIPNKSPMFDPDWEAHGHMDTAVQMLHDWAAHSAIKGFQQQIVKLPGRTPVLFCEIPGTMDQPDDGRCVLLYGHYDKQPEFSGWSPGLAPWTPVQRGDRLYGRGGADDGYALFGSLTAIEDLQRRGLPHPRCVVLIEGCEESGSYDLPFYVEHLQQQIGEPKLVICLDAECGNYDQLWVTNSLRGMLPITLDVQILEQGQHSGGAGGIVPSSFRILRHLLSRIEDAASGVLHEALQVQIPEQMKHNAHLVAQVLGPEIIDRFPWVDNARPQAGDPADLVLANTWQPSLAVVGLDGAPAIADAGNTLRPGTAARLVFRLPPTLDAATAGAEIKQVLEAEPPYGARVTATVDTAQTGWSAPPTAPWLEQALARASAGHFGRPAMQMGCGGTIPFMKMLGDQYPDTQFFVTGVLGPSSNAHGPNEFLHVPTAMRLTACVADVLHAASAADDFQN